MSGLVESLVSGCKGAAFTFNIEPVGKARPRVVVKNGRTFAFTPKKTANAEDLIRAQVCQVTEFFEAGVPLRMVAEFVMARPKSAKKRQYPTTKPDIDNCYKTLTDALEKFLYANDSQIVEVAMSKVYGETPCIKVIVAPLEVTRA